MIEQFQMVYKTLYTLPIVIGSEACGPSKLVVVTVTVIFIMGLQSEVATLKRCLHHPLRQAETGIVVFWLQMLVVLKSEYCIL